MGKKIHGAVAGWFDHGSFCIEDSVAASVLQVHT